MKHVCADDFKQADWLAKLAGEHLSEIDKHNGRLGQAPMGRTASGPAAASCHVPVELGLVGSSRARSIEITWGSICSGSEGLLPVVRAVEQAYSSHSKVQVQFTHLFSCEKHKGKQKWIQDIFDELDGHDGHGGCLFNSAEDMGKPFAQCAKHQKKCPVPDVDVLVVGTSCKDLSRANPNQNMAAMKEKSSPGGSGNTFQGLLHYLERRTWTHWRIIRPLAPMLRRSPRPLALRRQRHRAHRRTTTSPTTQPTQPQKRQRRCSNISVKNL